jgi:hypothetical protein
VRLLFFLLFYSLPLFPAQTDLWQNIARSNPINLKISAPSRAQLVEVKKALLARVRLDNWPCAELSGAEWTENLQIEELPVSETDKILLVEAGPGCARGAQGANGAMWIIRFRGDKLSFLATPQQQFNGWLYSIQETTSHGFRDLVLGWHMSAGETDLNYFRFDGTSYKWLGAASQFKDADGTEKIIPKTTG